MRLIAIDGHDGAGKTTLATALAERVGALYVRPFGGARGDQMVEAWRSNRPDEVLRIGEDTLGEVLAGARDGQRLVLDRGWLTVATLVPRQSFAEAWRLWLPTALIWCDEQTTRARLRQRVGAEAEAEVDAWPAHFLHAYRDRLELHPGPVIRTDELSQEECLTRLVTVFDNECEFDIAPDADVPQQDGWRAPQ
jgi:hypothetical protein